MRAEHLKSCHGRSLTLVLFAATAVGSSAQQAGPENEFVPHGGPYPRYYSTGPRDYNLRWGRATGRLYGSVQAEFNDNINLADQATESDVSFAPILGIGFLWPISDKNVLEFDISAGYRVYLEHPELNTVSISPDSRLSYQIRVFRAQITVHDQFSVQVDPLTRPELSGTGEVFNYQRFNNNAGVTLNWPAIRDVTLTAGYSYVIDRTMSGDFEELDRDDHVVTFGAQRPVGARATAGLGASYVSIAYVIPVQNDGKTFSVGPNFTLRLTDFITADGGVSYTISDYEPTGTITDQEDFEGITFYAGLRHRLNSRTTHSVRISQNVDPGYGSNFTDILGLQYGIALNIFAPVTLNSTFVFENLSSSGPTGEDSQRFLWYMGSTFRLSSKWFLNASYGLGIKNSELPGRDYEQNRFTLQLTRRF